MDRSETTARAGRRALTLGALATALFALLLGFAADPAQAAYTAKVKAGTLTITGNGASDKLALRLQPGSSTTLQVDVGDDGTADLSFDRNTFTAIVVEAGRGDDEVRIDQTGGAFVDEAVTISGGPDADTLLGGAGAETFVGGSGNDVIDGGTGNDKALLGDGDDRFQWDPGDASDIVEGQRGTDALVFNGSNVGETIEIAPNGQRTRFSRNVGNVVTDLDDVEQIGFRALGGPDTIVVDDLAGTSTTKVELDLDAFGGGGDLQPDTVIARGTEAADSVGLGNAAGKILVSGLAAQIQVAGGEADYDNVVVATLGGADTIALAVGVPGPVPVNVDGGEAADTVRYSGTAEADQFNVVANGTEVSTLTPATTRLDTSAVESLVLLGQAGADSFTAVGNLAPLTTLTYEGGEDNDTLSGGNGADVLLGGNGNDQVDGNQGSDTAFLGDGDDRFQWDPGDGNDTVEGQTGIDRLDFNGSNIGEKIEVSANGSRVRFTRDIAAIATDLAGVERIGYDALGGADTITVDNLAGTDATTVELDLSAFAGGGDLQADSVIVNGSGGPDVVDVSVDGSQVVAAGLAAQTRIAGSEAASDSLRVQTLDGDDDVTVAPTVNDLIATVVDLGGGE